MSIRASRVIALLVLTLCLTPLGASELVQSTPLTVAGATTVDAAQAKQLFDQEALFVDLRKENMWNAGRIPGALWLDFKKAFSQEALEAEAPKDTAVVFYCSGDRCPRSAKACEKAVAWGYTKVYYFRGGFPDWKNAGYPVE
jgi:rhodanese-related sulfurtransferase